MSDAPVPYGATVLQVATPRTYSMIINPTARVLKALRAGKRLNVSISTTFQNARGGPPVTQVQSVTAKLRSSKKHHK